MNFKVKKEHLEKVVANADKISSRNLSLPVLQCIKFEVKKTNLILSATNLDLGYERNIPASVKKEGVFTIPSDILNSFLSNLKNIETIEFSYKNKTVLVKSGKYEIKINTLPEDDFPTIPKTENGQEFKIKSKKLSEGLRSVWFSASTSNVKPELSSVFIKVEDGNIFFVSTDSFRLSEKKVAGEKIKDIDGVLLPQKNISEIIRITEDTEEEIKVRFNENQISFQFKNTYLTSRIIDGTFPDYKQIIPKDFQTEVIILKEDLVNALKLSNIFSGDFNQTTFEINPEKKKFTLSTKNKELGSGKTNISGKMSGKSIKINFNHKYISDCFQSINSESINLSLAGEGKPMLIRGGSDDEFTYVVMPMNK